MSTYEYYEFRKIESPLSERRGDARGIRPFLAVPSKQDFSLVHIQLWRFSRGSYQGADAVFRRAFLYGKLGQSPAHLPLPNPPFDTTCFRKVDAAQFFAETEAEPCRFPTVHPC